jgi:hypothetical protein
MNAFLLNVMTAALLQVTAAQWSGVFQILVVVGIAVIIVLLLLIHDKLK